jgi:hypothetical protein
MVVVAIIALSLLPPAIEVMRHRRKRAPGPPSTS